MPIVADATVFRYLVVVGATDILPALFGTVLVPPAVVHELQHASTPAQVRTWWRTVPLWVQIQPPRLPPDPALHYLGEGEQEAIRLMDEQQAPPLMTDDRDAYNAAVARGLAVTRTLRVLEIAAERGLFDLPTIVGLWAWPATYIAVCHLLLVRSWLRRAMQGPALGASIPRPMPVVRGPPPHRAAALPRRRGVGAGGLGGGERGPADAARVRRAVWAQKPRPAPAPGAPAPRHSRRPRPRGRLPL
jgi:predicted nucleic acid-binding protein